MNADEKARYKQIQQQFADIDVTHRRAIVKAVNRGQAVEIRKHAPLAVMIAQRQIRFWRVAWLIAPALGIGQLFFASADVALMNGLFGTLVLATLAWFWIRRANQAVERNRALERGRVGPPTRSQRSEAGPSDASDEADASDGSGDEATNTGPGPSTTPRPPAPRGRKRRDKRQG